MTGVELVILGLAAFRFTRLVVEDTIINRQRAAVINRLLEEGRLGEKVAEGLLCTWCAGVWVSGLVAATWFWGAGARPALIVAAVAGLQGLLSSVEGR